MTLVARRLAATAVAATLLGGLAACGGGTSDNGEAEKLPQDIVHDAGGALTGADSVHVVGTFKQSQQTGRIDMRIRHDGLATGTVTTQGATGDVVRSGARTYVRGRALWNAIVGPQGSAIIGDRWVAIPDSGTGSQLSGLGNLSQLASEFVALKGSVTKGDRTAVDGQPAIAVRGSGGTLYVATTGTPYPLRFVGSGDTAGQSVDFRDYDAGVDVSTPASSDTVDISALLQALGLAGSSPSPAP